MLLYGARSKAHRQSYVRRTAVERSYSTVKDPARNDISKGWCRVMGLSALTLWTAALIVVRNQRVDVAFSAKMAADERRQAAGLAPRTRRRRRRAIADLVGATPANAPP